MKTNGIQVLALMGCAMAAACNPLDESNWTENITVSTAWAEVDPETAHRPDSGAYRLLVYGDYLTAGHTLDGEEWTGQLPTDKYDILVVPESPFVDCDGGARTASIIFPSGVNGAGELEITKTPDAMLSVGYVEDLLVKEDKRQTVILSMKPYIEKVDINLVVSDTAALGGTEAVLTLSGLATEKRIFNKSYIHSEPAVGRFVLPKHGISWPDQFRTVTEYHGTGYILGTAGKTRAEVEYTDWNGVTHTLTYYPSNQRGEWITGYSTLTITVTDGSVTGWDWYNTSNYYDMDI
jgi:hypothetical protein